jgi:isopentenyl-diphosphate delta-isomerase
MREDVILVTKDDIPTGTCEKMYAHHHGFLHRAFSIFVHKMCNNVPQILLQKRHHSKYHSPGLWTNTCCSHPKPDESLDEATHRRLKYEMGFTTPLVHKGHFVYRHEFDNSLIEHEYDHVFVGEYDKKINPHPEEVSNTRYIDLYLLVKELTYSPQRFTPWLSSAFQIAYKDYL